MIDIEVGKLYCVNPDRITKDVVSHQWIVETYGFEPYKCVHVSSGGNIVWLDVNGERRGIHKSYLMLANMSTEKAVHSYQCSCESLMSGCSCGAFQKEMESKGKIFNSYLRMWE